MTQLIKGDVVLMRGVVTHVDPDKTEDRGISVKLQGYYTTIFVDAKDLTFAHHQFEVGDRVRGRRDGSGNRIPITGHVRAVNGDLAWVDNELSRTHVTIALRDLELAPAPPKGMVDHDLTDDVAY